jgi:hypothetical protein
MNVADGQFTVDPGSIVVSAEVGMSFRVNCCVVYDSVLY